MLDFEDTEGSASHMDERTQALLKERYQAAVQSFVEKVKDDPNVIAVIVGGSVAYDVVWERSDIDTTIVIRDQPIKQPSYCILEDGITLNLAVLPRSSFRRGMERNIGGSFGHSFSAKSKIVYCTDDSLAEFFEELKAIGSDDMALATFYYAADLVGTYEKCQKWLTARRDPLYAQYYLLKAAETIAHMELCLRGEPASRESIQKALQLAPEWLKPLYGEAMSHHFDEEEVRSRIELIERYLDRSLDLVKRPVLEYMADQELKTVTMLSKQFHADGHFLIGLFNYLADKGVIEKVSQTIRITPKSKPSVEEIGFLYIP